jgi:hypothetical protein
MPEVGWPTFIDSCSAVHLVTAIVSPENHDLPQTAWPLARRSNCETEAWMKPRPVVRGEPIGAGLGEIPMFRSGVPVMNATGVEAMPAFAASCSPSSS